MDQIGMLIAMGWDPCLQLYVATEIARSFNVKVNAGVRTRRKGRK